MNARRHAEPGEWVLVATYNPGFGRRPAVIAREVRDIIDRHDVAVLMLQETKNLNLHELADLLGLEDELGVAQRTASAAMRNSAIVWDLDRADRIGHVGARVAAPAGGRKMLDRYLLETCLDVDDLGPVWFASAHRPPQRFRGLWRRFDATIVGYYARHVGTPTVLGFDANAFKWFGSLRRLVRRTRTQRRGVRIDHVLTRGLEAGKPRTVRYGSKHPVVIVPVRSLQAR